MPPGGTSGTSRKGAKARSCKGAILLRRRNQRNLTQRRGGAEPQFCHCEEQSDEAILSYNFALCYGLLRYARNDRGARNAGLCPACVVVPASLYLFELFAADGNAGKSHAEARSREGAILSHQRNQKTSRKGAKPRRGNSVIARNKATKQSCHITLLCVMDCFDTLAMTGGNAGKSHAKARRGFYEELKQLNRNCCYLFIYEKTSFYVQRQCFLYSL